MSISRTLWAPLALALALLVSCAPEGSKKIVVGAKNFTEQYIVGSMAAQILTAAGYEVTTQFGTGSTITREGLETGQTDLYPEYTGTAWVVYLKKDEVIKDPEALYQAVKEADAANGITWLSRFDLNNTYALAVKEADSSTYGASISQLAEHARTNPGKVRYGIEHEFLNRPDGFQEMTNVYDLPVDSNLVSTMDVGLAYEALDRGQVDVAMVFSTDGLLKKFPLKVLEDDKQFFPVYNLAFTVRQEVLERHPEVAELLEPLAGHLDNETMQNLNARVDSEGLPADVVAREALLSWGMLK